MWSQIDVAEHGLLAVYHPDAGSKRVVAWIWAPAILLLLWGTVLRAQPPESSLQGDWVNVYELAGSKEYARMSLQQSATAVTGTSGIFKLTGTVRNGKIELQGT